MQELEKIIQKTITNYPTCPIEQLLNHLQNTPPTKINEKTITNLINQLENHENEIKNLRKQLENQLLNYQINQITQQ